MDKQNKFFLADLHTKDAQEGFIEGIASTWQKDLGGDRVEKGAFSKTLPNFMQNPVMLFSHQLDKPIGKWTSLIETESGLEITGSINTKTTTGKDVYNLVKNGDIRGLSIGYGVKDSEMSGDTNVLKEVDLWEVSIVSIPMNQQAWLTGAKIIDGDSTTVTKFDSSTKWIKVARSMASLLFGDFVYKDLDIEARKKEYDYISGWYRKFKKALPEIEWKSNKFEFKEDEKFIYELSNLKSNTKQITDILKHWQKTGGEIPADEVSELAEVSKTLQEMVKQPEPAPDGNYQKDLEEIQQLSDKVKSLEGKFNYTDMFKKEMTTIVKDTFMKATGKKID